MPLNSLSVQEMAALNTYIAALQTRFENQLVEVLLFGSKARGDVHPGSDIDLLVILNDPNAKNLSEARALGFDILLTYDVFLSIRAMSQQQWQTLADIDSLFYRNLTKDGIPLLSSLTMAYA